jgi:hypothetical protein
MKWMLVAAGVASLAGSAVAQIPALTFTPGSGTLAASQNQSVGWEFNVTGNVTVTHLAWYDRDNDGLTTSHTVGLWDPSGTLLSSAIIPAGTAAPLVAGWRIVPVTPFTLGPGVGYIVGGENFTGSDPLVSNVSGQATIPQISYVDATFSPLNAGFTRPTARSVAVTGFYGPGFFIPSPAGLAVLGLAALGAAHRRRG